MIVLDTNVLSETMRGLPEPSVVAWLGEHRDAVVTSVTVGEILRGALQLPAGRRRDHVLAGVEAVVQAYSRGVLPYDDRAARVYARLHQARRAAGRPLAVEDGMIAATAIAHDVGAIATRNTRDFADLGIDLVDPWDYQR